MRKPDIWILLADASRARIVRNPVRSNEGEHAPLETIFDVRAEPRPLRDIMSDTPGRSFASSGARRSAMEYRSDPVRDDTRKFALSVLSFLEARFRAGEFDQLVICAPPRMLRALRELMPRELVAVIRSETPKDFTKVAGLELRQLVQRLTALPD